MDVLDDHYYRSAAEMAQAMPATTTKTDRSGPKIFVGEWASTEGSPTPTMQAALGDAAWMTGMERNSDIDRAGVLRPAAGQRQPRRAPVGDQPHRL